MQINIIGKGANFFHYQLKFIYGHEFCSSGSFKTKAAIEIAAIRYLNIYFFEFQMFMPFF